eukprot:COSAG04_NODE_594_length_12270_cov_52.568975_6_plen_131_part_00
MSHAENIHSAIPAVHRLMSSPAVHGALTSILGEGYALHPHTFMHVKDEVNGGDGDWHKRAPLTPSHSSVIARGSADGGAAVRRDGFLPGNGHGVRFHQPEWALVCYYPQETSAAMGPTEFLPGTLYCERR